MISVENVGRRFGPTVALEDVSFTASDGEVVGLLGPNGAGKTTMIRILTGILSPTEGRVVIDGKIMENDSLAVKRKIGYLPENNPLYGDMRIMEYLRFVAEAKGVEKSRIGLQTEKVVRECGLSGWEDRTIGKLSKGFRQRVGLAQAVVNDPSFVVLDEPTSGLDPEQIVEFRHLIREMRGKRTVVLSTHILPDASATCDRIVIIRRGRVVAADTVPRLSKRMRPLSEWVLSVAGPGGKVRAAFQNIPGLTEVSFHNGESDDEWNIRAKTENGHDPRADFLTALYTNKLKLLELFPARTSLEEIFLDIMTEEGK